MKNLTIIIAGLAALSSAGCAITTAGVKKGDERNFARSVNDVSAGRAIKSRMTRAYDFDLDKVDVEVAEGIAVLTGSVPTNEDKIEAERIAWSAPHVDKVGNEIQLNSKTGLVRSSKDTVLSTSIKSRLIAEKHVKARNVNIETHNGVVYLMGVARDQAELERITYLASTTKGAKEVISYIKISGQPVISNARYASGPSAISTPESFGSAPLQMDPNIPRLPAPGQRSLPDSLSTTPQLDSGSESFYRDPHTGERIILPPGTKTIPYDPSGTSSLGAPKVGDAPYYIDPSNGEKVQIIWTGE